MKKSLLIIGAFALMTTGINAQITVVQSNIVGNWEIVKQAQDTMPSGVTIGSAGASQTWDISTLVTEHYVDTLNFIGPAGTPGVANFPTANMCMNSGPLDSTWIYLKKDATGLFILGQTFFEGAVQFNVNSPNTIITFPSTMGTTFSVSNSSGLFALDLGGVDPDGPGPHGTVDSVKIIRTADNDSDIDGWGDAITPLGTFEVIRQNEMTIETDSTFMLVAGVWEPLSALMESLAGIDAVSIDTNFQVSWWSNDPSAKFPVMEMSHDNAGTVYSVNWLKETPTAELDDLQSLSSVVLYPNPASDEISIKVSIENAGTVIIRDLTGSVVGSSSLSNSTTTVNVEHFNNGMYFYTITDNSGSALHTGKFIVKK